MKTQLLILLLIITSLASAQVGINNPNPIADLDVVGNVITDGKLFLENPGNETQLRGKQLLIRKTNNEIVRYDVNDARYGPINYTEVIFQNLSSQGLLDFDTKISTSDYIVSLQNYFYFEAGTTFPEVVIKSSINTNNIKGFQAYAYKNTITNTWFLRVFPNNSDFQVLDVFSGNYVNSNIDLHVNLIIYRNNFLTKDKGSINVNASGSTTLTTPLPFGF